MNYLILNRDFRLPDDGWYHIAPLGEFPHTGAGVIQVIDQEACIAMAARFAADAKTPNFPGLLVDFDHFSLDCEKRSEAAGWIIALESRCEGSAVGVRGSGKEGEFEQKAAKDTKNAGLWAQIRWSDLGEAAVKGGRYRFLSPVWARVDCVDLGDGRLRPVRLLNAAVTNDPNLKGMVPLSNRAEGVNLKPESDKNARSVDFRTLNREGNEMKSVIEKLVNHLGLAADATEAVILERMAGLPSLNAVTELQNSLAAARTELDALKGTLKTVEGELVNRHLEEFAGVVTEKTKGFWTEQLVANRAGAVAALADLRELTEKEPTPAPSKEGNKEGTRKPLHNRVTARPVIPGQGGGGDGGDSKAVKIRNRAHEIAKAEGLAFGVAFRRAEREIVGQ